MKLFEAINIFKKYRKNVKIRKIYESESYFEFVYGDPDDDSNLVEYVDKKKQQVVFVDLDELEDTIEIDKSLWGVR